MNHTPSPPPALDATALRRAMQLFGDRLEARREEINRLNVYPVPDGDTGDNLTYTIRSVLGELERRSDTLEDVCAGIARGALFGARGSSGVIMSQALRGFTGELSARPVPGTLPAALRKAAALAYSAVSDPTEGTILTVARDAAEAAADHADVGEAALAAAAEARRSLARTPDLLPVLAEAGVVDAGGMGYLLFVEALTEAVTGITVEPFEVETVAVSFQPLKEEVAYRYEIICLVDSDEERIAGLRRAWSAIGDTVAMVGGGDPEETEWRCHVHTNEVGAALDAAREAGEISDVEITDLTEQVGREESFLTGASPGGTSLVAVAEGDGLISRFLEGGAARVVTGGASKKPSTAELLRAVESCEGPVVLIPGDKDVIPAALQAAENASGQVIVVPAPSMLAGLLSLEAFSPTSDAAANAERMSAVVNEVRSADIKPVVRKTETPIGPVEPGQWLAIGPSGGVAVADDPVEAVVAAADTLIGDRAAQGLVVVDDQAPDGHNLEESLKQTHPDVDWVVVHGGRPMSAFGVAVRPVTADRIIQ